MKKKYTIYGLLIVIILVAIGILLNRGTNKNRTDLLNNDNIYIYGDWNNNITAFKDEKILIQVPIYDFSNEIDTHNISVNIENFNIGKISDISLENKQEFDDFTSYTLQFYMSFDKTGYFELTNIKSVITINNNTYSKNIGSYQINVYDRDSLYENIEITGGTGLIEIAETINNEYNSNYYLLSYRLKNNSKKDIIINEVSLNNSAIMSIDDNFNEIKLSPNEEKTIEFGLHLDKNIKNTIIKPKITYKLLDETMVMPGTEILIVDPVSIDRLYELIKTPK